MIQNSQFHYMLQCPARDSGGKEKGFNFLALTSTIRNRSHDLKGMPEILAFKFDSANQ
jgi:hypothetical protein